MYGKEFLETLFHLFVPLIDFLKQFSLKIKYQNEQIVAAGICRAVQCRTLALTSCRYEPPGRQPDTLKSALKKWRTGSDIGTVTGF